MKGLGTKNPRSAPLLICGLTCSALAKEITLSNASRTFPHALPGRTIVLEKVYDTGTHSIFIRGNDPSLRNSSDLAKVEAAESQALRRETGALSRFLFEKMRALEDGTEILVQVSLKLPEGVFYPNKSDYPEEELKSRCMTIASMPPVRSMETVLGRYKAVRKTWEGENAAVVSVNKVTLQAMAFDEDIGSIEFYEPPKPTAGRTGCSIWSAASLFGQSPPTIDIRTLAQAAYSHSQTPLPTNLANGAHAATFEIGLTAAYLGSGCLNRTPAYYETMPSGQAFGDSIHSLVTFTNLANAAPGAALYHHRSISYFLLNGYTFLYNYGIQTVSVSYNYGWPDTSTTFYENRTIDDLAFRYPYPVVFTTTGNDAWYLPSHVVAWNAISVGNVKFKDTTTFVIDTITCGAGATQTRNPNPHYRLACIDGGTLPNCAGDREMPYLVSPGSTPFETHAPPPYGQPPAPDTCRMLSDTLMSMQCISQPQNWGTSMSAPTANGIAADLIGQNSYLSLYPELTRAILLNTAQNVKGGYWNQWVDGQDGAGVIHGAGAIAFATNLPSVSPGNAAVTKARHFTSISQAGFNNTARNFNVAIPNPKPAGQHLRAVLTWDALPSPDLKENELPDIDLALQTSGGSLYSSYSWESNVEMIDVPASATPNGSTAVISYTPNTWRRASNARSTSTNVALTWGFVADHAR